MIRRMLSVAAFVVLAAADCPEQRASRTAAAPAQAALENAAFGSGRSSEPPDGWNVRGEEYGEAVWVESPHGEAAGALELRGGSRGSTGSNSLMVLQELDPSGVRGRTARFGARIRTEGAGVNLVLYTPEGSANILVDDPGVEEFELVEGSLEIPEDASYLSLGIQLFGREGDRAWVDDVFLEIEGGIERGESMSTRIVVDAAGPSHPLERRIFGMHIEWVDDGQGLMESRGTELREPVMDLLEPLDIPLFRFPGGIHADYYDWRLGTGPVSGRARSVDVFARVEKPHRFGSPEFLGLLERTGAEALITANAGTGDPAMAEAWARWFREQGESVRLWEVGNELYLAHPTEEKPNGAAIFRSPEEYARLFPEYRRSIRGVFPEAEVGIIGHLETGAFPLAPSENRDWTERMLRALDTRADFIAVHNAYAPVMVGNAPDLRRSEARTEVYRSMYAASEQTRENLDRVARTVAELSPANAGIPIAVTEFGPLFGIDSDRDVQTAFVDHTRTMGTALYVASVLHVFLEDPAVMMAAYTNPIHEWFGSLITDTPEGLIRTPTYHVYELYGRRLQDRVLQASVDGPSFRTRGAGWVKAREGVPEVLTVATVNEDRTRMGIVLVNRSPDGAAAATLELGGFSPTSGDCVTLSAAEPWSISGPRLSETTLSGTRPIEPEGVACAAGSTMEVLVPANGILSVVLQGGPAG